MIKSERGEALAISTRLMAQLSSFVISKTGREGADFRWAMGRYLSNFADLIDNSIVGATLRACFDSARLAGATLNSMDNARKAMIAEAPEFSLGDSIVNAAVIFSFAEQAKIIAAMEFRSQGEVEAVLDRMTLVIEEIKLSKSQRFAVSDYRNIVALSALLIQHLAATRRVLPRIVQYRFQFVYPSLAMSNRIYGVGSRAEELAAENTTVHPAFMQRHVIALSE